MSAIMMLVRMGGVPLNIETSLASLFGTRAWAVGFAVYLVFGGIVALAYGAVFEWVLHQAGVGPGLLLGACNTIVAGFIWAVMSGPGRFWQHFGAAGMAALFLVHFAYGAVVGGLYRTKHTLEYW
jgi:hypothetical protein